VETFHYGQNLSKSRLSERKSQLLAEILEFWIINEVGGYNPGVLRTNLHS
jgi:hypothetical protein